MQTRDSIKSHILLAFRNGDVYVIKCLIKKYFYHFKLNSNQIEITFSDTNKVESLVGWQCIFHSAVLDYQSFSPLLTEINGKNISTSTQMYGFSDDNPSAAYEWDDYTGKARNAILQYLSDEYSKQITFLTEYALTSKISWISAESNLSSNNLKWPEFASVYVKDISLICNELTWQYNHVFLNVPDLDREPFDDLLSPMIDGQNSQGNVLEQFKSRIAPGIIAAILSKALAKTAAHNNNLSTYPILLLQILRFIVKRVAYRIVTEDSTEINPTWEIACTSIKELSDNDIVNVNEFKRSDYIDLDYGFEDTDITICFSLLKKSADFVKSFVDFMSEVGGREVDVPTSLEVFKFYVSDFTSESQDDNFIDMPLSKLFSEYITVGMAFNFLEFSWNLSSGEQARLELFSRIYDYYEDAIKYKMTNKLSFQNLLILMDEADMLLHPEWQRNYVKDLKEYLEDLFHPFPIHIQVIIATHSPIMLSDIPSQNTLLLKKDEKTNLTTPVCNTETFAANIYSLFKNSFFLDTTMIGAFAEHELKELAKNIHNMSAKSDHRIIRLKIDTIGDEFIRKHFLELYHETTEVERLQHEVELLKNRIALLEGNSLMEGE